LISLGQALGRAEGEHRIALEWFRENAGRRVPWSEITDDTAIGARIATQAKGIYKPEGIDFALSVRQTLNSPYADLAVERRPNGGWVYPYYQEGQDPSERDRAFTNRGLMKCMQDQVPVGVLIQHNAKPNVHYDVLGLALVSDWQDGYFILEGFSQEGTARASSDPTDAGHDRASAGALTRNSFAPDELEDTRERVVSRAIRRRGQQRFRQELLQAYNGRCAVTGCDATEALEAAHITPYLGADSNHPQNGLLLRSDIHQLFDLGLFAICPLTFQVRLGPQLAGTVYSKLDGKDLTVPDDAELAPSSEALRSHAEWTGITMR
jgi:putative restriction endonuclease